METRQTLARKPGFFFTDPGSLLDSFPWVGVEVEVGLVPAGVLGAAVFEAPVVVEPAPPASAAPAAAPPAPAAAAGTDVPLVVAAIVLEGVAVVPVALLAG